MIRFQNISKSYTGQTKVLDQVSFQMKQGEFLYLLGGTGAGKSTLLKILSLQEEADQGQLELFGYASHQMSTSLRQAIRQSTGYIPQTLELIKDFSVFDNLALSLAYGRSTKAVRQERMWIFELLEKLQLIQYKDAQVKSLSGGEAQRVAVAAALVRKPQLLICDEPTGAQDQQQSWAVLDWIVRLNVHGTTVLLATHDREMIRRVRKRCLILKNGKAVLEEGVQNHAAPSLSL